MARIDKLIEFQTWITIDDLCAYQCGLVTALNLRGNRGDFGTGAVIHLYQIADTDAGGLLCRCLQFDPERAVFADACDWCSGFYPLTRLDINFRQYAVRVGADPDYRSQVLIAE